MKFVDVRGISRGSPRVRLTLRKSERSDSSIGCRVRRAASVHGSRRAHRESTRH